MVDGATSSAASSAQFPTEVTEKLKDCDYVYEILIWLQPSMEAGSSRGIAFEQASIACGTCLGGIVISLLKGLISAMARRLVDFFIKVDGDVKGDVPPGSLEFRATYVSLLLFRGSYIWIKFRDRGGAKADEGYLYWRKKEKRWEPRYSPSRTRRLSLGRYIKEDDAKVVLHAAQYYFNEKERTVDLCDGFQYSIQHMSDQERDDTLLEKLNWVHSKAKQVLRDYKRQKKKWELEIWSDEFLRDIEVNQLPNLQNGEVQAEQQHHSPQFLQFLKEQNSSLKAQIAEYDPTGGRLIQHLQSDNAKLESILEQLKTIHGCSKNGGSG